MNRRGFFSALFGGVANLFGVRRLGTSRPRVQPVPSQWARIVDGHCRAYVASVERDIVAQRALWRASSRWAERTASPIVVSWKVKP